MEPSHQQGLLEDLVAPWKENLTTFPSNELYPGNLNYLESLDEIDTTDQLASDFSHPSFLEPINSSSSLVAQPTFHFPYNNGNNPFDHNLLASPFHSSFYNKITQEECRSMQAEEDGSQLIGELGNKLVEQQVSEERKNKFKKVEGQPSKNLLAERRRRKRLNERLSMLRSIVPKISKMDRISILGDTIDYMKELLQKIHTLKEKDTETGKTEQLDMGGSIKELIKMDAVQVRTLPKFEVQRQNKDTRIEICCSSKPGLLLDTVSTLDAFGLDIQQCVVSCFNDFSLKASCSEGAEHRRMLSSEDVKQVLFKAAGYGGRFLWQE